METENGSLTGESWKSDNEEKEPADSAGDAGGEGIGEKTFFSRGSRVGK